MTLKRRKQDAGRKQAERDRKKELGLIAVTVYVPTDRKQELRELARMWCAENVQDCGSNK